MKANRTDGKQHFLVAGTGALVLGATLVGSTPAMAEEPKLTLKPAAPAEEQDDTDLVNWINFGVGGNFVSGDKAQFQQQKRQPASVFGGIEAFHYERPFQQKGLFSIDGSGLFDNHDYDLKLSLSHPDKGYVRASYSAFREYYDGTGGYLPSNGRIFQGLIDNRLAVDRAHTSFEAGLTLPDVPMVSFRYDMDTRKGTKDSTSWGTTTLTPGSFQRKITPSYRVLDETRHLFSLDVKHKLGTTEFGVGGRYELQDNKDQRNVVQQPTQGTTARILSQNEGISADISSAHAFTDTKFNEQWELTTGYSFTTLRSLLGGSRRNTPLVTPLSASDTRYANLLGGSSLKQYVMNLNLMYSPSKDWYIIPSLRVEKEDLNGSATDNTITGTAVQTVSPVTQFSMNDRGALKVTEALDVRYVGITNWVFYVRSELSEDQANVRDRFGANVTLPATVFRETEWDRLAQKHAIGANWYPARTLSFAAQYYRKMSDNDYTHQLDSSSNNPLTSGDRYPAYIAAQNFDTDDFNVRATWRPISTLTLVSRYDFQLSRAYNQPQFLAEIQSAENERHMFGESVSWVPINWMYIQANGNYVLNTTHSPAEDLTGAGVGVILSAPNNYWTAGTTLGFALDNKTELQLNYSYYQADNYVDNSAVGMPYGAGAEQHEVGATLGRQLTRNLHWSLRYAFSSYKDQTSGGAMDYTAHGIMTSMQYRF